MQFYAPPSLRLNTKVPLLFGYQLDLSPKIIGRILKVRRKDVGVLFSPLLSLSTNVISQKIILIPNDAFLTSVLLSLW